MSRPISLLAVALLVLPAVASAQADHPFPELIADAQSVVMQTVSLEIRGYARASTTEPTVTLMPSGPDAVGYVTVRYATNYGGGRDVVFHLEGDRDQVLIRIEPEGAPVIERRARAGSPGRAQAAALDGSGAARIVVGMGQVVAAQRFRVTARATGAAPVGPRTYGVSVDVRAGRGLGQAERMAPSSFTSGLEASPRGRHVEAVAFISFAPPRTSSEPPRGPGRAGPPAARLDRPGQRLALDADASHVLCWVGREVSRWALFGVGEQLECPGPGAA